jgi:hypothetical protein
MFNNQGTSKPEASQKENGDMAWACCEELVELDDVQLATVVGGWVPFNPPPVGNALYKGPLELGGWGPHLQALQEAKAWYARYQIEMRKAGWS